jgi:hypothetical protein
MKGVINALIYAIIGYISLASIAACLGILIGIAYKTFHWIV